MSDVIVVGSGFAGMTAARECAQRGLEVTVLEARERLGGRTWSSEWHGLEIEYGGAWLHFFQPHVWAEVTRAGLATRRGEPLDRARWWVDGTARTTSIAERDAVMARAWAKLAPVAPAPEPDPYHVDGHADELHAADTLSLQACLNQAPLTADERSVASTTLCAYASSPLADAGFAQILRLQSLVENSFEALEQASGTITLVDGTGALVGAIADQAGCELVLDCPVARIEQDDAGARAISAAGEEHLARAILVAVPLNVLASIEFVPPLPERTRRAIAHGQASRGVKVMLRVDGPTERQDAYRLEAPLMHVMTDREFGDGTQLLTAFGPDAARCNVSDLCAVQEHLDLVLPGYRVLDAVSHDWLADPYSRGTWCFHRPRWLEQHQDSMQQPAGRVTFAGGDVARGWVGHIDGAIESWLRAAGTVCGLID
jgi:monoamine oxidase